MPPVAPFVTRYSTRGMVASIDHLASSAGVALLRAGGTAVDAAVATSAVLAVTCQHLCGMGGDLFALVHPVGATEPSVLNASGRSGSGADPERLRAAGHTQIPRQGDPAAVPVPGCVDGWLALHSRFGRRSLDEVFEPARVLADDGFPASPLLARSAARLGSLDLGDGAADFLPGGRAPRAGQRLRRPGIASALGAIAERGRDAWYGGAFGEGLLSIGAGEYDAADLDSPNADWVDGLSVEVWGRRLWTVPPNSQGYLTLAGAWIAEGLDLPHDPDDALFAHFLIESARQAGHDRITVLHEGADGRALVEPSRLGPRRDAISPTRAAALGMPVDEGGTIYLCAVDGEGMGVSLIQSNYRGFGSMLVVPGVRVFLQNRGAGFSLERGHPAEYGPRKRPPHTLSPALVTHPDGRLDCVVGTMGGDSQPQVLLQLLARRFVVGQDPGDAIAAPRWVLAGEQPGVDVWARDGAVRVAVEEHAPAAWFEGLEERGHELVRVPAWSSDVGHAHLIAVDDDGVMAGASDPRSLGGAALGY